MSRKAILFHNLRQYLLYQTYVIQLPSMEVALFDIVHLIKVSAILHFRIQQTNSGIV